MIGALTTGALTSGALTWPGHRSGSCGRASARACTVAGGRSVAAEASSASGHNRTKQTADRVKRSIVDICLSCRLSIQFGDDPLRKWLSAGFCRADRGIRIDEQQVGDTDGRRPETLPSRFGGHCERLGAVDRAGEGHQPGHGAEGQKGGGARARHPLASSGINSSRWSTRPPYAMPPTRTSSVVRRTASRAGRAPARTGGRAPEHPRTPR